MADTYAVIAKKNGEMNEAWMNLTRDRVVQTIDALVDETRRKADEIIITKLLG